MDIDRALLELSEFALSEARRSTRDKSVQDELEQLGLIQITKVWEEYPDIPDGEMVALSKIAIRNKIRDYWRKEKNYQRHATAVGRYNVRFTASHNTAHDEAVVEELVKVLKAKMGEPLLTIFEMRLDGATIEDMMRATGRGRRQVFTYLETLKEMLARAL